MRGSAAYASFVIALFATAWLVRLRAGEGAGTSAAPALALAGVLFALSLALRSIDQAVWDGDQGGASPAPVSPSHRGRAVTR
jgi:hypothetical protein